MNKTYNKGAIGLLVVMGVGFLALAGVLVMSEGVLSGLITEQNTTATIRAFYASESVMQEGVSRHLEEVSKSNASSSAYTLTSNLSFTNGATAKEITVTPEPGTYRFTVKGEAESNKALRKIVKTLTSYPAGESFNHALYSAVTGTTTVSGNLKIEGGDVYSVGGLALTGNASVDGDVYSSTNISVSGNASYTGIESIKKQIIPPPEVDYEKLKEIASSTYTYFTSGDEAEDCIRGITGNCNGNVVYIDNLGLTTIKLSPPHNTSFTGSIISPGSLSVKGDFYAINNYPAIVAGDDLDILGGSKIDGLVLAEGDVKILPGNTSIKGAILITGESGNLLVNGTVKIEFNPATFSDITEFVGLGFESDNIDSIMLLDWHEE